MSNGSPPSSRSYAAEDPVLVEARGTFRDALGGVGNLDQLLRSLRVGPKALSAVLPDVLDSFGPAEIALERLLRAAAQSLESPEVVSELGSYFKPRLNELRTALESAVGTPMHARHRLELERVVTRVTPELDAARGLLELLEAALSAPSIRLKLRELLSEIAAPEAAAEAESVMAYLTGDIDDVELPVQPQVALSLFTLGINLVANENPEATPRVAVHAKSDGGCTVSFETGGAGSESLHVARQHIIAPTIGSLDAAVTRMGCRVERVAGRAVFSVSWS